MKTVRTMSKPIHVVVLGSINMDLVIRCAKLPSPGETLMAESSSEFCGGKGANQAVAAARAGAVVNMIGRVGNDSFANRLIGNLQNEHVLCDHVTATAETPSGLAVVSVDDAGENSIIVVPGANGRVSVSDVEAAADVIRTADILLVQLEVPVSSVVAAIRIARAGGVRVILDPAPAPATVPDELLDVTLICPNETEAAALTGLTLNSSEQQEAAVRQLHQRGAANVALTLGDKGTLLFDGRTFQQIPSIVVDVVDTTAAGDAFAGALAVYWAETRPLADAVRRANVAGAIAASRHGAQPGMATAAEIESALKRSRE
ncbi:MAG: ribokinase [Planctomycetaceae bacterium]